MTVNRQGYYNDGLKRECTYCGTLFEKRSNTVTLCPKCNCDRVKRTDPRSKLLARAKARAKRKGIDFNIGIEDIVIPDVCPMLGVPLRTFAGASGGRQTSPSLDRINSKLGYIKGNVQVVSHLANCMKNAATKEQLISFSKWITKTYGG